MTGSSTSYRSGFCAFVGRPNAGKSTLTNALIGSKIVITSDKPQTTRRAVRGVLSRPDGQLVIVDTPGLHRPRTLLGQRLNDVVREALSEVDVVGFCIPANDKIGPGDRFIAAELQALKAPAVAIVTKTDTVNKQRVAEQLMAISKLGEFVEIVPVSARAGDQVSAAGRPADGAAARRPAAVPGGDDHRRERAEPDRRADPRGGAGRRPRRAAALDRGHRGGDEPARERRRRPAAADRHLRDPAPGAVQPEADHPGQRRQPAEADRHRSPARHRGAAGPAGRTSTCTSR